MSESYYETGEQRAQRVRDLFTRIARRYDLINDLQSFWLHRFWKRRVISLASARAGDAVLDVCCGTGDLAVELSRRGARVVGLDFTGPMLEVARSRAGLPWVQGDALHLPFADKSFDILTIAYGLRNLADWQRGLREMLRVARPSARILILEFGKPPNALWRNAYFAYLRVAVPVFGKVFCGDSRAYAYILESLQRYPAQGPVSECLRALGCREVRLINLLGGAMTIHLATR